MYVFFSSGRNTDTKNKYLLNITNIFKVFWSVDYWGMGNYERHYVCLCLWEFLQPILDQLQKSQTFIKKVSYDIFPHYKKMYKMFHFRIWIFQRFTFEFPTLYFKNDAEKSFTAYLLFMEWFHPTQFN